MKGVSKKKNRYQVLWSHRTHQKLNPKNYQEKLSLHPQDLPAESAKLPTKTIFDDKEEAKEVADQLFRILVRLGYYIMDVRKVKAPTKAEIEKQRKERETVSIFSFVSCLFSCCLFWFCFVLLFLFGFVLFFFVWALNSQRGFKKQRQENI